MLTILVSPNKAFKFFISGCPPDHLFMDIFEDKLWHHLDFTSHIDFTAFFGLFLIFHSFCPFNCSIWKLKSRICRCWSLSHGWLWLLSSVWFFGTPGSSVLEVLQARILGWVAIPFSGGSSQPRDWTQVPCMQADSLPSESPGKPLLLNHLQFHKYKLY